MGCIPNRILPYNIVGVKQYVTKEACLNSQYLKKSTYKWAYDGHFTIP